MFKVGGKYDCTAIAKGSFEGYDIILYSVVVVTQLHTHIRIHRIHKSFSKEKYESDNQLYQFNFHWIITFAFLYSYIILFS